MHMNSLAPISITGTPGLLWKCGTTWSLMNSLWRGGSEGGDHSEAAAACLGLALQGRIARQASPNYRNWDAFGRVPASLLGLSAVRCSVPSGFGESLAPRTVRSFATDRIDDHA